MKTFVPMCSMIEALLEVEICNTQAVQIVQGSTYIRW